MVKKEEVNILTCLKQNLIFFLKEKKDCQSAICESERSLMQNIKVFNIYRLDPSKIDEFEFGGYYLIIPYPN